MLRPHIVALFSAFLAAAGPAPAAPAKSSPAFPFPIELHTLPNGLRVALVHFDSPGLVAYYTLMRVGSRNEVEPGRSGFAHFFEHMMFRGTKAHSGLEYDSLMSKLGLNTNAFTDADMTVYNLYGPSKALPTIIELEGDRFQNLEYDEPSFKTEAGSIRGEYDKSASDPEEKLTEKMLETAFERHPYQHTVIGYLKDIDAMPAGFAYSREFFRRYYTPDNATIVIVGDFDGRDVLTRIEKAYGGWQRKLDAMPVRPEPRQTRHRRANVAWDKPTLPRLWIAWHSPASRDLKSAAAQEILNAYLFGTTSPLYQSLVLDQQLVDSMDATWYAHRDPYLFGVLFRAKDPKAIPKIESAALHQIRALVTGGLDRARLEAVRSNLRYAQAMRLDKAASVAVTLAITTAQTGDPQYLNQLFAAIEAVKPADLVEFAKRYLTDANRTTVTLVSQQRGGGK